MLAVERLPIDGTVKAFRPPGHARNVLDVVGLGDDLRWTGAPRWRHLGRLDADRFPGWRRQVLAPAEAQVVAVHDGEPDRRTVSIPSGLARVFLLGPLRSGKDLAAMAGNHVILELAGGFLLLAHLRRGTIGHDSGDHVSAGVRLGEVGNSGNSLLPHLHVQPMTSADPYAGRPMAWQVRTLQAHDGEGWVTRSGQVPLRTPMRTG